MMVGMNIRWDYFVNQYDAARYVTSADGRDDRRVQFVREFASVVSVLQVNRANHLIYEFLAHFPC
jgi:dynein heavy chain 1